MRFHFRSLIYLLVITSFATARADSYVDFFRAVATDNAGTVQAMLAKGFDPNTLSEKGLTPLYIALQEENPKVTAVLLASPKLKVDLANPADETALMMAALRGNLDAVRRLVDLGAQVRRAGWTPAHYAAAGPNVQVLAFLLDRGADVDAVAPNGSTPLMMAAGHGTEDSVRLLIARGANKRLRNNRDLTAADLAAQSGREWMVPLLR